VGYGWALYNGRGVAKDDVAAVGYWKRAAAKGSGVGESNLGGAYASGRGGLKQDYAEARRLYELAISHGYNEAYYYLGSLYREGRGVPVDDAKAVEYFKAGADRGESRAQNALGYAYQTGRGVPQDLEKASAYFKLAAEPR
jgi:TPR repeat protein